MKIYRLRVSIIGISKLYRIIEASERCTLDRLHEVIFDAFNRYDAHLYSFFVTRKDTQNSTTIWKAPEITHPAALQDGADFGRPKRSTSETTLGALGVGDKEVFHYLFDFGDEWWHRIRVESVTETDGDVVPIRVVKSVGAAPPQYMDDEDDDEG
jgi:hypothetical protein